MSTSQTISRLSLFDVLVKIIPGLVLLTVVLALFPSDHSLVDTNISETAVLALSIPVSYVVGALLQGISSNWFPRKKYFQSWMRNSRDHMNVEKEDEKLVISGGDHIKSIVLADTIVRFNLDRKCLEPSSSSYDQKPRKGNWLIRSVCMFPIYLAAAVGLVADPGEIDRVYYGGENFVFNVLREHASKNGYAEFMRFQRIYVLHRSLTMVACISFLLSLMSVSSIMTDVYNPLLSLTGVTVLLLLSFLSVVTFYSGMSSYEKIRDERLLYRYYADKSESLLVSPKYAPETDF